MNAFEAYSRESDSEATGNNDVRFFYRRCKHSIAQVGVFLQVGRFIFICFRRIMKDEEKIKSSTILFH